MKETLLKIEGAELVETRYGYWPGFHDAEIISIYLERLNVTEQHFNSLTITLNHRERKVINDGTVDYDVIKDKDSLITFKFTDITDLEISDFNQQNVIDSLLINETCGKFKVIFESIYGADIRFHSNTVAIIGVSDK